MDSSFVAKHDQQDAIRAANSVWPILLGLPAIGISRQDTPSTPGGIQVLISTGGHLLHAYILH